MKHINTEKLLSLMIQIQQISQVHPMEFSAKNSPVYTELDDLIKKLETSGLITLLTDKESSLLFTLKSSIEIARADIELDLFERSEEKRILTPQFLEIKPSEREKKWRDLERGRMKKELAGEKEVKSKLLRLNGWMREFFVSPKSDDFSKSPDGVTQLSTTSSVEHFTLLEGAAAKPKKKKHRKKKKHSESSEIAAASGAAACISSPKVAPTGSLTDGKFIKLAESDHMIIAHSTFGKEYFQLKILLKNANTKLHNLSQIKAILRDNYKFFLNSILILNNKEEEFQGCYAFYNSPAGLTSIIKLPEEKGVYYAVPSIWLLASRNEALFTKIIEESGGVEALQPKVFAHIISSLIYYTVLVNFDKNYIIDTFLKYNFSRIPINILGQISNITLPHIRLSIETLRPVVRDQCKAFITKLEDRYEELGIRPPGIPMKALKREDPETDTPLDEGVTSHEESDSKSERSAATVPYENPTILQTRQNEASITISNWVTRLKRDKPANWAVKIILESKTSDAAARLSPT